MAKIKYQTALGRAKFPHLNTPDTAFDTVTPKFKVELIMSAADAEPLIKLIKSSCEAVHGKADYRMPVTKDEETGEVSIKVQSQYQPTFIDSTGAVIEPENIPRIGGGSELRAGGTLNIYTVSGTKGVALMLNTIQIGSIVAAAQDTSDFGALEGGNYVAHVSGAIAASVAPAVEVEATHDF
jgi:hypothetical protein